MNPAEPLANARHERFACELAKGDCSIDQAYTRAGFRPHRSNAARLSAKDSVQARKRWVQEAAQVATSMTIAEKRQIAAEIARNRKERASDRISACRLDNDLAGEGSEAKGQGALAALLGRLRG